MKKIKIAQNLGIILVLTYIVLVIANLIWGVLEDKSIFVFSVLIVLVGSNLIYKGTLLKSTSTLWFAYNLIFGAILIIILEIFRFSIGDYAYLFAILPLLPSLINVCMGVKIYIKVMIINLSISIPIIITTFVKMQWYLICIVYLISIVMGIVICRNLNLDKEKIDDKI